MKRCLSCNCPQEQPASFADGLCEACYQRIERLREPMGRTSSKPEPFPASEPSRVSEPSRAPTQNAGRKSASGVSTSAIALILVISGFGVAGACISFDSRLGGAIFWGGTLCTVGSYILLTSLLRETIEPLQKQNAEVIALLKQIAEQTSPRSPSAGSNDFNDRQPISATDELAAR